jgi:hypothetical protein
MHNFDFVKPSSVADATKALGQDGAQALSGGQTLLPTMKQRLATPSVLVSLTGIAEMKGIRVEGGNLVVGGATPHVEVTKAAAKTFPALAALAGGIGDPAVRNRGTIGGSLANNDPAACYPSAVMATGATIATNRRKIAADDYFQGLFSTALDEGEFITAVHFPIPRKGGLREVQPTGQPLCPDRGVRGQIRRRCAGRRNRCFAEWGFPLGRGRGGAVEILRRRCCQGLVGGCLGHDQRSAWIESLPRQSGQGADGPCGHRRWVNGFARKPKRGGL